MKKEINQQQKNKNRRLYDFCEECQTYHQAIKVGNYLKINACEMPIQLTSLVEKQDKIRNNAYHYQLDSKSSTTILSINNHISHNNITNSLEQLNQSRSSIKVTKDNSQSKFTNNILNSIVKNNNTVISKKDFIYNTPIKNQQIKKSIPIVFNRSQILKSYIPPQNEKLNKNLKPILLNRNWKLQTIKEQQQNSIMSSKMNSPRENQYKYSQKIELQSKVDRTTSEIKEDNQSFCCGLFGKKSY